MGGNLAGGAAVVVVAAVVASAVPAAQVGWRFALVALAFGGFAAVTLDQLAMAGVAVLAWLVGNGFLENRLGELSWHGSRDVWLMMALVVAGALGLALGEAYWYVRDVRAQWWAGAQVQRLAQRFESGEERGRDA